MLSDCKKFIFIHLQKTGGSSIEYALSDYAHEDVVLNDDNTEFDDKHITFYKRNRFSKSLENTFSKNKLENYFKFSIVRNPWDRMVSWWMWMLKEDAFGYDITLEEFLLIDQFRLWKIPQIEHLTDSSGVVNVSFIGKFENLENDMCEILNAIDVKNVSLPKINAIPRKHYSEYYTDETIEIVRGMHSKDIEYFGYTFDDRRKITENLKSYVFYHDAKKLEEVTSEVSDNNFTYVDLNELPLPEYLVIKGLDPIQNRAVFSEYLGLLQIIPDSDYVGFFTYSIPKKFSVEWAVETEYEELFIPEFYFNDVRKVKYSKDILYALEFKNPKDKFLAEINDIHENFRVGSEVMSEMGPYKGSFIVAKDTFLEFQDWFAEVTKYILSRYQFDAWGNKNSQFSSSVHANKSNEQLKLDKLRHGLGEVLERCLAYYFGQKFDDKNKVKLSEYLYQNTKDAKLYKLLHEIKEDNNVIIAVANYAYKDIVDNWVFQMKKLGIDNFLIIALDKQLYAHLSSQGVNAFLDVLVIEDIIDLWRKRIEIYEKVVRMGVNLVHSDLDAVWLRNPMIYFTDQSVDLVFSQGTYWPKHVHEKWGFVLCCGLFYAGSNKNNIQLFQEMREILDDAGDDQAAINELIYQDNVEWEIDSGYTIPFSDKQLLASRKMMVGLGNKYSINILPHHLFQRLHNAKEKAYVKHIYSPKNNESTKDVLIGSGCYFLEENKIDIFIVRITRKIFKYFTFEHLTSLNSWKTLIRKIKNRLKAYVSS